MTDGLPDGQSIALNIDRQKALALGVSFSTVSDMISTAIGSTYVNDFPKDGRLQQVVVQADAQHRMHIDDVLRLEVRNIDGAMVPLSEFVQPVWQTTPLQLARYNGYPAARLSGSAAPGVSSGVAMSRWSDWQNSYRQDLRLRGRGNRYRKDNPQPRRQFF